MHGMRTQTAKGHLGTQKVIYTYADGAVSVTADIDGDGDMDVQVHLLGDDKIAL